MNEPLTDCHSLKMVISMCEEKKLEEEKKIHKTTNTEINNNSNDVSTLDANIGQFVLKASIHVNYVIFTTTCT